MVVERLGWWWIPSALLLIGLAWVWTDHMLRAAGSFVSAAIVAAGIRLLAAPQRAGGLVVRSRAADVALLIVFAAAIAVSGYILDLRALN